MTFGQGNLCIWMIGDSSPLWQKSFAGMMRTHSSVPPPRSARPSLLSLSSPQRKWVHFFSVDKSGSRSCSRSDTRPRERTPNVYGNVNSTESKQQKKTQPSKGSFQDLHGLWTEFFAVVGLRFARCSRKFLRIPPRREPQRETNDQRTQRARRSAGSGLCTRWSGIFTHKCVW